MPTWAYILLVVVLILILLSLFTRAGRSFWSGFINLVGEIADIFT